MKTGYLHPDYAPSLAEFGRPRLLRRSGGWILERPIPGCDAHDAMGCYPLFACHDWAALRDDLAAIGDELVSLSVVTDPFGAYDEQLLRQCFPEVVIPFKEHFIADLRRPINEFVSRHHRYYAQKVLASVSVERCADPRQFVDEWTELYAHLITRHDLTGLKAFSRETFARQLCVPGIVMLRATHDGQAVGAHLWYLQGEVAYSHLTAVNSVGYELMASYALHWFALESFGAEVHWLNFGGGSGLNAQSTDGLTRFKRGWTTETRMAYFCGRILNHEKYSEILAANGIGGKSGYFPTYRRGEFA